MDIEKLLKDAQPKPDYSGSNTKCSECIGRRYWCTYMRERDPKVECNTYVRVGTLKINFKDGTSETH